MSDMPGSVKAISILAGLLIPICWTFFLVFHFVKGDPNGVALILPTAVAYTVLGGGAIFGAVKRNVMAVRACFGLIVLASLPAKAPIGIIFSLIGIGLTFRAAAKDYFAG